MPSYKRPGVYAEEVLSLSQAISNPTSGTAAFVAAFHRGPVVPTLVESWNEFLTLYGGFAGATEYLPFAVYQFFSNGGRQAYILRVAGTGAVKASRTINDSTNPSLRIDAENPGTWGGQIYVETQAAGTGRFNLIVRYGGTGDDKIVERWLDLSMVDNDARYAPSIINSITAGSSYIRVADLNSASADQTPVATSAVALTTVVGVNGTVAASDIQTAIPLFDTVDGPLTINIPGADAAHAAQTTLLAYCAARGDCFAVIDPAMGQTVSSISAAATALASAWGAVYYPWVYVADPSSNSPGAIKLVPPGGSVIGQYAQTDATRGIFKAPAGIANRIVGAVGVEARLTNTDLDTLNTGLVNAIRQMPGAGVVIMGARTLKSSASDRYVPTRRTLNFIRKALLDGTRWAVFEPNDATLWGGISTSIQQFLLALWQRGGLRGTTASEAFYVRCDSSNNTPQDIASGQVNIEVGVALQYPAEFVVIRIGQWEGGATATVTV